MFQLLWIICRKEIIDALRDSKSLATALFTPIITALVFAGSFHLAVNMNKSSDEITLPVAGAEFATPLMQRFKEAGIKVVTPPENPENAILEQQWDAVLVIPEDFVENFRQQKPSYIELLSDHSRSEAMSKVGKIRRLIQQWSSEMGSLRLIARNVDPNIANAVSVQDINVTSDQRVAAKILSGLPLILMIIMFGSGVGMASDLAAGERERKSLESLLINPITPSTAFLGKSLATFIVAFCIVCFGFSLQIVAVNFAPLAELGIRLNFGVDTCLLLVTLGLPTLVLATSMQLLVSYLARSFKDAQAYNMMIVMMPTVPCLYLIFNSGSAETWQMLVPILGTAALYVDVLSGELPSLVHVLLSSLSSLLAAALMAALGIAFLQREKTILQ